MFDPSSFANPTPLAHADTSRDVLPRGVLELIEGITEEHKLFPCNRFFSAEILHAGDSGAGPILAGVHPVHRTRSAEARGRP
ncbi:hypothetical protein TNCV_2598701 [Trichonephila clavipes]|nr:hypothetical protein TNCV_2598701 [Trichonephila clavipes]